ncbi:13128_t:CDS:2, partial [Funneliformis mosseae]
MSCNRTSFNFYGDYLNNGTISNGNYTTTTTLNVKEKREPSKSEKIRKVNSTAYSQSTESLQPAYKTPPQAPQDLTSLEITSNKRLISNEEILQYSEDISVICVFDKTISELTLKISVEFDNKLFSVCDTNPE